ncbi:hypothetical protein MWU75_16460, partial [Ornithinimicrobium sp. F0845]|nr:hypothetical protein [Ornithinimicrobium sp. F0845]
MLMLVSDVVPMPMVIGPPTADLVMRHFAHYDALDSCSNMTQGRDVPDPPMSGCLATALILVAAREAVVGGCDDDAHRFRGRATSISPEPRPARSM